jgi:hypothetical protein
MNFRGHRPTQVNACNGQVPGSTGDVCIGTSCHVRTSLACGSCAERLCSNHVGLHELACLHRLVLFTDGFDGSSMRSCGGPCGIGVGADSCAQGFLYFPMLFHDKLPALCMPEKLPIAHVQLQNLTSPSRSPHAAFKDDGPAPSHVRSTVFSFFLFL